MKTLQFDKFHKSPGEVNIQLIRNATLVVKYNGYKILVDPMFSEKGAFNSFAGKENNPTIDLKVSTSDITRSLDLVLVTHTHSDHFDVAASQALDESVTLFHQPSDTAYFQNAQFVNARSILDRIEMERHRNYQG